MKVMPGATPTDRRRSRLAEAGLWGLVLAGMLSVNMSWSQDGNYFVTLIGGTAAVAVTNRRLPPAALAMAVALAAWDDRCFAVVALVAFLAGRYPARRPGTVLWVASAVVPAVGAALLSDAPLREISLAPIELLGLAVLPWLVGRYTLQRLQLDEAGWARADQLEHEQRMVAEQTRLRERARIAQDMHDSLGHDLGLLAVRAAVLEMTPGLDETVRAQAAELRAGAGAATERLHEIIGVLREESDDDGAAPVAPGPETPEELVGRCLASGMTVALERTGEPDGLSPMTVHALHRVLQEALTNAAKHAPGAPVRLRVVHGADATDVRIANDPPVGAPPDAPGSGRGLTGLRERVRLLGGTLEARPADGGGFLVTARLPHQPAPTAPPEPPATPERLVQHRRTLRRGFVKAAGLTVGGLALAASVFTFVSGVPSLSREEYASFALGASRAELADDLPGSQYGGRRPDHEPPAPTGAVCEYYGADESFSPTALYRLCFREGRLVAKDRIPLEETASAD